MHVVRMGMGAYPILFLGWCMLLLPVAVEFADEVLGSAAGGCCGRFVLLGSRAGGVGCIAIISYAAGAFHGTYLDGLDEYELASRLMGAWAEAAQRSDQITPFRAGAPQS
jgi:hypothetical protein